MTDLKMRGALVVDGVPVACRKCDTAVALAVDSTGPRETWPASVSCTVCGHAEDHPALTNGLVAAALDACGRQAGPEPTPFTAAWREHTIAGERAPEFNPADLLTAAKTWAEVAQDEAGTRWRSAKGKAHGQWLGIKRRARDQVGQVVGGAKAAALSAAWQVQTGGAGPAPKPRARRCRVKGCRGGWVTIRSRVHSTTGRAQDIKVPCAACGRAA